MQSEGARSIFLAWKQNHADLFDNIAVRHPDAVYFPLNQKAAAPYLQTQRTMILPPFWTLVEENDLEAIDHEAERFADLWRNGLHRKDVLRAWIWAREAAYVRRILEALEGQLKYKPQYLVPHCADCLPADWHGATVVPQIVIEEWEQEGHAPIVWVPELPTETPPFPSVPKQLLLDKEETPKSKWILFSSFGVPDIAFHLDNFLNSHIETIVLLMDPHESGPLPLIYERVSAAQGRIRIVSPYGDPPSANIVLGEAPDLSGILGKRILQSGFEMKASRTHLETLFDQSPPELCVVSDHDCPHTVLLGGLCTERNIPMLAIPHSSWPMLGPFLALPPEGCRNWIYSAATRRGAAHLANQLSGKAVVSGRPMPSPRYRMSARRFIRVLMKWLSPPPSTLKIGVAVTSGEAILAQDISLRSIGEELGTLLQVPEDLCARVQIHIRLRQNEDQSPVLEKLARSEKCSVIWESANERTPVMFLQDMDLLIEIGMPGSIMFESFAELVPFMRLGGPRLRRAGYSLTAPFVPKLSSRAPWDKLTPFVEKPWRRRLLALRQLFFLLNDTGMPGQGIPKEALRKMIIQFNGKGDEST
jgi:hypothetical protein